MAKLVLFVSLLIQLIAKFHHSFPEDETTPICTITGFHGVTVSTQDSESCDPSSNLGGTYTFDKFLFAAELQAYRLLID